MGLAVRLTLEAHTPLPDTMNVTPSLAIEFFNSKNYESWQKTREAEWKLQAAVVDRLNEVIRGTGIVAKIVAKKPTF